MLRKKKIYIQGKRGLNQRGGKLQNKRSRKWKLKEEESRITKIKRTKINFHELSIG